VFSILGHLDTLDIYGVASGKLNGEAEFLVELVAVVLGWRRNAESFNWLAVNSDIGVGNGLVATEGSGYLA
jgi:hypothetical protein